MSCVCVCVCVCACVHACVRACVLLFQLTLDISCVVHLWQTNLSYTCLLLFQLTLDIFSYVAHLWQTHLSHFLHLASQHDDNMATSLEQARLVLKGGCRERRWHVRAERSTVLELESGSRQGSH